MDATADGRLRVVIVGATSSMAVHCARLWAQRGDVDFVLAGRDAARLADVAADLRVRGAGATTEVRVVDVLDPAAIQAFASAACAVRAPDIVLVAHGSLPEQSACEQDLAAAHDALRVNGVSPALFAEAFAAHLARAGRGTLALIGSVAGDRGRRSNYVYGAAKGLLTRYAQGLQHRFAGTGVRVVLVKPGPTDTPMTAAFKAAGVKLAPVDGVARAIVRGIDAGTPVIYAPAKWRLIMLVIRHLPAFVFNRLNI